MKPIRYTMGPHRVAALLWLTMATALVPAAQARIDLLESTGQRDARSTGAQPEALPDIFGPGAVLGVGNVRMKITNLAVVGNPFTNTSSDPSAQWPGASGIEYLNAIAFAVGAVNTRATDPVAIRRVSYFNEWRPATLDPEDKIYRAYDGIVNGTRFVNDDRDVDVGSVLEPPQNQKIDEDFLDGRDNDGDGNIDEDFGALGQEMYSCSMWDNTIQAINTTRAEKHVPLDLECRQKAWAYSIQGFQDFNVIEYEIFNRSGHDLDSLTVGWLVDMDCGPNQASSYWTDDLDIPHYPNGEFVVRLGNAPGDIPDSKRRQHPHDPELNGQVPADSALCPRLTIRVNGFSIADDNGDEGRTIGVPSFMLINHTTDPTGASGPTRVGFNAFRSFTSATPYQDGGNPTIDQQRFELMTATNFGGGNIDPETGFISRELNPGDTRGDFIQWASVGPWRNVPDGASITVTIAFGIKADTYAHASRYRQDYDRYRAGALSGGDLLSQYPGLANAFGAQLAYEGIHERREEIPTPDYHGRETGILLPRGSPPKTFTENCEGRPPRAVTVTDQKYFWFDFDCDYCTGVWDYTEGSGNPSAGGYFHRTWNAAAPPPNPTVNVSTAYNYTDNSGRLVVPSGDGKIAVAWDNLSEVTPDPKSGWFDFRGYRVWKVSDWTRPVGSPGPAESDWKLIGEFRLFEYDGRSGPIMRNYSVDSVSVPGQRDTICPMVYVPNYVYFDPVTHSYQQGDTIPICLDRGDLWDRQSGVIIKPDLSIPCVQASGGGCETVVGCRVHTGPCAGGNLITRTHYPVGRYKYVDSEVKNGFIYFYSVTALDSTYENSVTTELGGRRSSVEAEGVFAQAATRTGKQVWVVPNPYRGYARISDRPSAWDLTPNAADPTGTHIDFMGLPPGQWTIRIYTVSGDLVQVINSTDPVNESLRPPVRVGNTDIPGYNRQQDYANDGQARWNLISRNGQDIVSGIYIFTVESSEGTQRGRFVVIR